MESFEKEIIHGTITGMGSRAESATL